MYTGTFIESLIENVQTAEQRNAAVQAERAARRAPQAEALYTAFVNEFQRHESFFEVA